jgi:hypothetical protein
MNGNHADILGTNIIMIPGADGALSSPSRPSALVSQSASSSGRVC